MLYVDLETYSEIDLRKTGADRYARDCEILLFAYAIDDGPARVWHTVDGEPMPKDLANALWEPSMPITAHNSQFDRWVLEHQLGLPRRLSRWHDTMIKSYTAGMPGALKIVGPAFGLSDDAQKMAEGNKLVLLFCKPRPASHKLDRATRATHPEEWATFVEYARQDVVAMRELDRRLPNWVYDQELVNWRFDQSVNDYGLPIDSQLVEKAIDLCEAEGERLNAEVVEITNGALTDTAKRDRVLAYLNRRGVSTVGYTKADVSDLLQRDLPDDCRRILEIRQQLGRTSTAKYEALRQATVDGRLRGAFQFYGAERTGRWAGRKFQPQNLPRSDIRDTDVGAEAILSGAVSHLYDDPMSVAASCIRSAVCAPEGSVLLVSDYSNIEGRLIAWYAGEAWKIAAFEAFDNGTGPDLYKLSYSKSFGVPVDEVDKDGRQIGKVSELACGYQGWVGAFQQMAVNYGITVSDARAAEIAGAWRAAHPATVEWWYCLEDAMRSAVTDRKGRGYAAGRVSMAKRGDWTLIKLPSGRYLCYFKMELTSDGLKFWGINQYTRKWARLDTYGGKLANNCTQGLARDVLAHGMRNAASDGMQVLGTVHDEVICEEPEGERDHSALDAALLRLPEWAEGLPLAAAGYTARRYRKD